MRPFPLRSRSLSAIALVLAASSLVVVACGGGTSTDELPTPSDETTGGGGEATGGNDGAGGTESGGGGQAGAQSSGGGGSSATGGHAGTAGKGGASGGAGAGGSTATGGQPGTGGGAGTGGGSAQGGSSGGTTGQGGSAGQGPMLPSPIRHIVVMVKENHTFDNYFTGFPGATSSPTAKLSNGTTYTRKAAPFCDLPVDMSHSHASGLKAYDGGKMDGFDQIVAAPNAHQTFDYYPEAQIPSYWAYAKNYVLADHFFSTILGPSSPGHFSAAMSFAPHYGNANDNCDPATMPGCDEGHGCMSGPTATVPVWNDKTCSTSTKFPCFSVPTLMEELPKGFTWRAYAAGSGTDISSPYAMVKSIGGDPAVVAAHFRATGKLKGDLESGDQPNLVWVDVNGGDEAEHPPRHPCPGENYTVEIVNALMQSPNWMDTVFILTWDDWGGWYDNVKPAHDACGYHTGFRIPLLIISPYAKKGYVLKTATEHASIPKLIEDLWGMPRLASKDSRARDDTAGSLMGALDFASPPRTDNLIRPLRTDCPKKGDTSCLP